MDKIIEWFIDVENLKTVLSVLSAGISFSMWRLNRRNSILSSYTQKAKPQILIKDSFFNMPLVKKSFYEIKLNTSEGLLGNEIINTNKKIILRSTIGGIRESNLIDLIEKNPIGTSKTLPSKQKEKVRHLASKPEIYINSSMWSPYKIMYIDNDNFQIKRYCKYLIIEDYLGNIEVSLVSLKLISSIDKNKLKIKFENEKVIKQHEYYYIIKENIVTKWNVYSNLERVKSAKEISEIENNYKDSSEEDIEMINDEFDLFEMKKYIEFLKMLDLIKLK